MLRGLMEGDLKKQRDENIPPEIIDEILLKLPIKSLLRSSSVSKYWNSSVFSPWFIKKYRGRKILVLSSRTAKKELTLTLWNGLNQTDDDATTLVCPFSKKPVIEASCDALLCVRDKRSLFLWNPWMRTCRKLCGESLPFHIIGLGYDAVADDYKMLNVTPFKNKVELYSLRSDSWRKIQLPPVDIRSFRDKKCVFVNGTFYWIASRTIISFDLSTETFGNVTVPVKYLPMFKGSVVLASSKGKLCVCVHYLGTRATLDRCVMWTMEDYGVAQSWTKTFKISFDHGPIEAVMEPFYELRYLHSYDDGRILIEASDRIDKKVLLFVYEGKKVKPVHNVPQKFRSCFSLVESLVSPNT